MQLAVNEVVVGAAAAAAELTELALGAFAGEHCRGEFSVVGESFGVFPDLLKAFCAKIAFGECGVVHGFAAAHISLAVDADGGEPRAAAAEKALPLLFPRRDPSFSV